MAHRSRNVICLVVRESHVEHGNFRCLIQKRSLHCRHGTGLLGLPGGKINRGERSAEACIREVYEETGIKLHSNQLNRLSSDHHGATIYLAILDSHQYHIPGHTKHGGEVDLRWGYHGHKWCSLSYINGRVVCQNTDGSRMWHRTSRTLQLLATFLQGSTPLPLAMPIRVVSAPPVGIVPGGLIVRTPILGSQPQPQFPMGGMPPHMMTPFGAQPVMHLGHGGGGRGSGRGRGGGGSTSRGPTTYNPWNPDGLY
tara:strand:- start:175 stop:936 length:762 start_codon:yes stop_codon:yes gene_type:complete